MHVNESCNVWINQIDDVIQSNRDFDFAHHCWLQIILKSLVLDRPDTLYVGMIEFVYKQNKLTVMYRVELS